MDEKPRGGEFADPFSSNTRGRSSSSSWSQDAAKWNLSIRIPARLVIQESMAVQEYPEQRPVPDGLNAAIADGDTETVKRYLAEGVSVHESGRFGELPMIVAAREGKVEIVNLLLEHGVAVDTPADRYGRRALYQAADLGHIDVVRTLIANGATIDALDNHGQSALYTCALKLANQILNVTDQVRWKSVQNGATTGHAAVAEMLILAGADVNLSPKVPKGSYSPEHFLRITGITRHLTLLEERAKAAPKRSFWSVLFRSR
jgi:ankyrin repeat protein